MCGRVDLQQKDERGRENLKTFFEWGCECKEKGVINTITLLPSLLAH
jgi:hypothetical protein